MHATDNNEFAPIVTQRLFIRRLTTMDSQNFFAFRSDPIVYKYQSWRPQSLEEIQSFISLQSELPPNTPDTWFQLAVCERLSQTMIGDCGLHFLNKDSSQVELGFTIYPPYQGQGYATEAVRALILYLFSTLNKHRVFATVDPRNIRSVRVLERVGMRKEAHFYKSIRIDNEWTDDAVYAILADEWFSISPQKLRSNSP